jgi:RNA polymerase sigma factor (sigma-70 family)
MSNRENLSAVFLNIRRSLSKVASTIVPPREIEDIVQEAYVRICEISNEEAINCPRSFLYRIVKNLALDHVKRAETRLSISLNDEDNDDIQNLIERMDEDSTFRGAASKEEFEVFCMAVRQLPIQCRRVFVLKKVYGYSQKEIATDLNISESTVEKHIAFGIKRCWHFMNFRVDNMNPHDIENVNKEIHYD